MDKCPAVEHLKSLNRDWPDWPRACRRVVQEFRETYGVPAWCQMPTTAPMAAYAMQYGEQMATRNADLIVMIASMYLWRMGKGVYRFAPEVYESLIAQPLDGQLPIDLFDRLPEWAVYIESPGLTFDGAPIAGFVAQLDFDMTKRQKDLQFILYQSGSPKRRAVALPLIGGTLNDALQKLDEYDAEELSKHGKRSTRLATTMREDFVPLLQLVLYLCSDDPDMPSIQHPRARMRQSGAVDTPKDPRVWEVGVRIGAAIRRYHNTPESSRESCEQSESHSSPRPHIRRAHWHHFWTGPLDGDRRLVLHWLPPIPVGTNWEDENPVVIHPVRDNKKPSST